MSRARVLVAAVAGGAALLLAACASVPVSSPPAASARFAVTGYAEAGTTTAAQLQASRAAMTMVGVDGVNLTPDGGGITRIDPDATALLHQAHAQGETAELLVSNYSSAIGDFDDAMAEKMFDDPGRMSSVVAALVAEVTRDHWDGITIDLEGLNRWGADGHTRDDNAGLARFAKHLKAAIGTRSVSICLTATDGSYADLGYDLPSIATSADHVVLMAYDQHGPTWSDAGAVGGYPWVRASLTRLLRGVPAARIQLGIAGYGYSWAYGRQQDAGDQYSDRQARAVVASHHATPHWDATQLEWHATLANGTILWWSDARSYRARVKLAASLKLGGVAVWSLSRSDPLG